MLKITDVSTGYGDVMVVTGIQAEVKKGELVSFLGANGAGKTTLLKTISGIIKPRKGSIVFNNETITNLLPHQIVERGIVQVPEGRKLFPKMSVLENLELGCYPNRAKKRKKENIDFALELFPDLKSKMHKPAGTLSGGQQQMVAIARGLMADPKLLILDEPSIGLSPLLTKAMFKSIEQIREKGVTVLLVEQNVQHALGLANRGYVIEQGRIVLTGTGKELLHNEHLKKAYLGM